MDVVYPDNERLTEAQKRRVLAKIAERETACESCGSREFEVGEALYMGFLFLDEEPSTYMVALTCEKGNCRVRTGIRLHKSEFLWDT